MSITLALLAAEALSKTASPQADQRTLRLTALYDRVCLRAFPDDKAVEAIMAAEQATELKQAEVKVTMGEDPARAWLLADGDATVWLEFPPYHACTVRWSATEIGDLSAYRALAARYEATHAGFAPTAPMDADMGAVHIHMNGERRVFADQSAQTLMVVDQHINDRKRRALGETGVSLRFVHQFAPPPPAGQ